MDTTMLRYPPAERRPRTRTVGGVCFEDPYPWLDDDTPETLAWQQAQDTLAREHLRAWPHYDRVRERIAALTAGSRVHRPHPLGDRWYRYDPQPGSELPAIVVSDEPFGPGRPLVDPSEGKTINAFVTSPDGRLAAAVLAAGWFAGTLRVLDTATLGFLDGGFELASAWSTIAWLPDGSGFYYTDKDPRAETQKNAVFLYRIGGPKPSEPEPLEFTVPGAGPVVSADGRWAGAGRGNRPDYVRDLTVGGPWEVCLRDVEGHYPGRFAGDDWVSVTTEGAPRGHAVAIPLRSASDRSTWRELVPESEAVLGQLDVVDGRYVVAEIRDVRPRIRVLSPDGTLERELDFPEPCFLGDHVPGYFQQGEELFRPSGDEVTMVLSTFTASPAIYSYRPASGELTALTEPSSRLDGMTVRQIFATSPDGTRVPMFLVHREDLDLSEPRPALLHAYGGFNISILPQYIGSSAPFLDAGGVYVQANVRGGGEYGRDWAQAGIGLRKQNTFDDVYAAAEHLIAEGITSPDKLGFVGGSNGGLTAGVVLTQRPDLFRAVIAIVPFLDLIKVLETSAGPILRAQYGNPDDPESMRSVAMWAPYENIRDGTAYPAVLLACGGADFACPPWHTRKMAARLQSATTSEKPILMRVHEGAGHMTLNPDTQLAQATERVVFAMEQLGLSPA